MKKIICINNYRCALTIGKNYDIIKEDETDYYIRNEKIDKLLEK